MIVYMYTFPDGMKYIGVTKNSIETRRDCGYQHNKPLQAAMRKYGWRNVEKTILEELLDAEEAFQREKYYISLYHTDSPDVGYNVSHGGKDTFRGLAHTEEHKKYISKLLTGRIVTDEMRERYKEGHSKERIPVCSINEDGTIAKHYQSMGEAAADVGGHKTNISRACTKKGKWYKGYQWAFDERKGGDLG